MSESLNSDPLIDTIYRRTSLSSFNENDISLKISSKEYHIDKQNTINNDVLPSKLEQYEALKNVPSKYLTPNLINLNKPTFSNEGILQDNSPGMFSVETISTTALNDMLYWDNSNDMINSKSDSRRSSWKLSNDNFVPNKIYEISGDTTVRSESKTYPIIANEAEHNVNLTALPPTEEDIPEIRRSRMSPQINQAAELLRSEIYSNPNKRDSSYVPLRLKVSTQQESTFHSNMRDNITHMLLPDQATPLSSIKIKAFEKYSADSGIVYMESPNQSNGMIFPNKTKTVNSRCYSDEEGRANDDTYNEKDRAESPQSDVPLDKETNMPFQHVDYDSVTSLDSANPSFDDIFSTWKIISVLGTCIVMPPLFLIIYYAGCGGISNEQAERLILKDAYLQDPLRGFYWDVDITWFKKLCFYLGTIELFLVIACICVGFAVGLTKGQ